MIINIEKSLNLTRKRNGIFGNEYVYEFVGPDIDTVKYKYLSVIDCFIMCQEATVNNLITLSSSIIDKTPGNPTQDIFKLCKTKKSSILYDKPTQRDWYKLQCFSLEESVFSFSFLQEVKNIKIRLRIEFIKCHTDSVKQ